MKKKHEWFEVQYSYTTMIQCVCGFIPQNQKDFDNHIPVDR